MKRNYFKITVIWIISGMLIGSLIGVLGLSGLIPTDHFLSVTGWIIRLCFGAIVLLIDCLCIWALVRPIVLRYIDRHGIPTIGKIEDVTVIPRPDQLGKDAWVQKVRFVFHVSYQVDARTYRKEYAPTCLTSRQALYPQTVVIGEDIPLRYHPKKPDFSLIDIPVIKDGLETEQKKARPYLTAIPVVITMIYIIAIRI